MCLDPVIVRNGHRDKQFFFFIRKLFCWAYFLGAYFWRGLVIIGGERGLEKKRELA